MTAPEPTPTERVLVALEAATKPSKAIDRQIALLIGWHRVEPRFSRSKHGAWIAPGDFCGTLSSGAPILDSLHGTDMHSDVPNFTSSVDAALTLKPDGWHFCLHDSDGRGSMFAHIYEGDLRSASAADYTSHKAYAPSLPLAICIAALRAIATERARRAEGSGS